MESTENVVEKLKVSGEEKRQILILMQDWEAMYADYAKKDEDGNDRMQEWFAHYGYLQGMYKGLVPYEPMQKVKFIPLNEKRSESKEPLMVVDFYSTHPNTRFVKQALESVLHLLHKPQAQKEPQTGRPNYLAGKPGARRYKVWNITNETASVFFNRYKEELQLYAVDIYFWKDRTEEMPIAEVTLPKSKAQETPQILNIDDLIEEV